MFFFRALLRATLPKIAYTASEAILLAPGPLQQSASAHGAAQSARGDLSSVSHAQPHGGYTQRQEDPWSDQLEATFCILVNSLALPCKPNVA